MNEMPRQGNLPGLQSWGCGGDGVAVPGAMRNGQWIIDNGQWTMDNGQWTMDNGQCCLWSNISLQSVIPSEGAAEVEESSHYRVCIADIRCEDPSTSLRFAQDDARWVVRWELEFEIATPVCALVRNDMGSMVACCTKTGAERIDPLVIARSAATWQSRWPPLRVLRRCAMDNG